MARLRAPLRAALLILLALLIALGAAASAFGADSRDPRCEAWEAGANPPAGVDMHELCPVAQVTTADVDLDKEPLLPYVVGLVVMACVLAVVGMVAMRVSTPKVAGPRPATDWWPCPACAVRNRPDRGTCFACQASRADAAPGNASSGTAAPATSDAGVTAEDPHPA